MEKLKTLIITTDTLSRKLRFDSPADHIGIEDVYGFLNNHESYIQAIKGLDSDEKLQHEIIQKLFPPLRFLSQIALNPELVRIATDHLHIPAKMLAPNMITNLINDLIQANPAFNESSASETSSSDEAGLTLLAETARSQVGVITKENIQRFGTQLMNTIDEIATTKITESAQAKLNDAKSKQLQDNLSKEMKLLEDLEKKHAEQVEQGHSLVNRLIGRADGALLNAAQTKNEMQSVQIEIDKLKVDIGIFSNRPQSGESAKRLAALNKLVM